MRLAKARFPKLVEFAKRLLRFFLRFRDEKPVSELSEEKSVQSVQWARAVCLMQLGRLDKAESAARVAINLQSENEECRQLLKQIQSMCAGD